METSTQFDLDSSIRQWRENLSASPTFRPEDLNELESHLRDGVAALQIKGLSAHEAFWVARGRIGSTEVLDYEYGKVNAEQVWLNRVLWMVIGSLAVGLVSSFVSFLTSLATVGIYRVTMKEGFLGPFNLAAYLLMLIGTFLLLWRSGKRGTGIVGRLGRLVGAHPVTGTVGVFLVLGLSSAGAILANILPATMMPLSAVTTVMQWREPVYFLSQLVWPVVFGWLLMRTKRKHALLLQP